MLLAAEPTGLPFLEIVAPLAWLVGGGCCFCAICIVKYHMKTLFPLPKMTII